MTCTLAAGWRPAIVVGLVLLLTGCEPLDNLESEPHPCDEAWGAAPDGGRIHVDAAAPDGGDGTIDAPFAWLERAELVDGVDPVDSGLEAARALGIRQVVLAAGEYPGSVHLDNTPAAWLDSELEIVGCGRDATELVGIWETQLQVLPDGTQVEVDVLQPALDISGDTTRDLVVRDLAVRGGRRGILVRDRAGSLGAIVVERVDVLESVRLGILVDGGGTVVELRDVRVEDVVEEPGGFGWGISVQAGVFFPEDAPAPVLLERTEVVQAQGLGILVDASWVQMDEVTVRDTLPAGGLLGRGVQLQNRSWGDLTGLVATGNSDAALHLHMPGRLLDTGLAPVAVRGSTLGATTPADVDLDGTGQAADGLSASRALEAYQTDEFLVTVEDTDFEGNPRTHVLAEGVQVEITGNGLFGDGTTYPVVSQLDAQVAAPVAITELAEGDELALNRSPLEIDDPQE